MARQQRSIEPDTKDGFFGAPPHQLGVFSNGDLVTDKGTLREDLVGRKFSVICTAGDDILWNQNEGIYKSFQEMLHPWTSTLTPFERG